MNYKEPVGYIMSTRMFDTILATRNERERKENPYTFVMNVMNREFGLKGRVTSISTYI